MQHQPILMWSSPSEFIFYFVSLSDINECELDQDNCAQVCINTEPGFMCDCDAGFALLFSDNFTCVRK